MIGERKNIAVIGAGISGLTASYLLSQRHHVSLYEANDYIGGHTATVDLTLNDKNYVIDTGFIVFNDKTYPNFISLLNHLGVAKQKTEMSFSVKHEQTGLEYNGHSLNSLFAQRRNLINPRFYYFLKEIMRFNQLAKKTHEQAHIANQETLGEFLNQHGFKEYFANNYILPMVAAIWSSSTQDALSFPLKFFLQFFYNHGLLNVVDRPQWYVVSNGSRSYIPKLIAPIHKIYKNSPVQGIKRNGTNVAVISEGSVKHYDEVILACHADQALALLQDPSKDETNTLSQMNYQNNDVILHTDSSLLPKRKKAWASWNYRLSSQVNQRPAVSYNMNILQGIQADETFCVSLNQAEHIAPEKILRRFQYAHPVFNQQSIDAQNNRSLICGKQHTHYCGAYWHNGFHEDGVNSALEVCERFNITLTTAYEQASSHA